MSSLSQFTINYRVQVNAALHNLTQMNRQIGQTNQGLNRTTKQFAMFATGATQAMGQLVPGFNGLSMAMRAMGHEFAAAALGVGILGAALATFIKTRDDYNKQRKEGMDLGISSTRIEDYQRKFSLQSKGQITREQTMANLQRLQANVVGAYTDPMQFNQQAKEFRLMGMGPMKRGGGAPGLTDVMEKLAVRFQKLTEEEARGVGKTMGLDQDFVMSLRNQGAGVNNVGMSMNEVKQRLGAEKDLDKFNQELATLEEKLIELGHAIGVELMPGLIKFVEWVERLVPATKTVAERDEEAKKAAWVNNRRDEITRNYHTNRKLGFFGNVKELWNGTPTNVGPLAQEQAEKEWDKAHPDSTAAESSKPASQDDINKVVKSADESNHKAIDVATDMQLAVNMFAQSVSTFANAIDEKTAWAAWAGELGKAAGLSGPGSAGANGGMPSTYGTPQSYDASFNSAAKKYGIEKYAPILKNIARVESSFRPDAENGIAGGLMGINHDNYAAYHITNPYNADQSIDAGAKIFSEYLKLAKGDVNTALMMYNAGPANKKAWNPGYAAKVMAGSNVGIDRPALQKRAVQENIASSLGMPLGQLQRGGATKGDLDFVANQKLGELVNQQYTLWKQTQQIGLRAADRSKIMTELRDTTRGINLMNQYPQGGVTFRPSDDRPITAGAKPVITININGGQYDGVAMGNIVKGHLQEQFGDLANHNATAVIR